MSYKIVRGRVPPRYRGGAPASRGAATEKLVDSSKPRGGDRRKDCNGPNGVVSTALAGQSRRVITEKSTLINR